MKCRRLFSYPLIVAAFVAVSFTIADAGVRPCIREAKGDARECAAVCKEDFQTAKDACLNRDHACVEVCRANRAQCRLDTGFDAAIESCKDGLEERRALCRSQHAAGTPERDACIDAAQVDAFECRDGVRELAKPLLKQCRKDFRNCAKACPAVAPATLGEDAKTCVRNAKAEAKACAAACKEAFQVAKDDCRNRDHECVEQCRADRHACKQPVRATLDAALDQCAAERQSGVDDCTTQYPPPRDEAAAIAFDQCVDGVQVEAFVCRDDAHEAARPGFASCHQAFRSCVQTNCPPLPQ
jgi:hypothetical protein